MGHNCFVAVLLAMTVASVALALPEGAPWGAANPDAAEHCGSCHFGYDPVRDSDALDIEGLPAKSVPGETYELRVSFSDPEAVVAGFQLLSSDGEFKADSDDIEYMGAAVRSTRAKHAGGGFGWTLTWTAPDTPGARIIIYVAAVGGNDDLSPFGDRAYFRTFETML
jgi:hypothetical protein